MKRAIYLFLCLLTLSACGGRRTKGSAGAASPRAAIFVPTYPSADVPLEEQARFVAEHYWDRFDFADTTAVARLDTLQMVESFAEYVGSLHSVDDAPQYIRRLMERASGSKSMIQYFAYMAAEVLYDPNSPLRSDELYIPVLEALVSSPHLDRYERMSPEYDLRLARRNLPGQPAENFRYTLASGRSAMLYDIRSPYTLLFISNPGCPMCADIISYFASSPFISAAVAEGTLTVLALYPDEDLDAWRSHAGDIPSEWINAYDKGCVIRDEALYDLKAIPALYLLDRDKRVIVKDSADAGYIEYMLDSAMSL